MAKKHHVFHLVDGPEYKVMCQLSRVTPKAGPTTRTACGNMQPAWFQDNLPVEEAVMRLGSSNAPTHVYAFWQGMGIPDKAALGKLVAATPSIEVS